MGVSAQPQISSVASDPLLSTSGSTIRSFSFHTMEILGNPSGNLTMLGSWYDNGTVVISDVRGHQYSLRAPGQGVGFSIFQNSTVIDQRYRSKDLNYDIYWTAKKDLGGFVDTLKFDIVGNSAEPTTLSFKVDSGVGSPVLVQQNRMLVSSYFNSIPSGPTLKAIDYADDNVGKYFTGKSIIRSEGGTNSSILEGIGIDWSDALASGSMVTFNKYNGAFQIPVGTSFNIDPVVIATVNVSLAPSNTDYAEDEKRIVRVLTSTISKQYAFYYDGANIIYLSSTDDGNSWPSGSSAGTGVVNGDYYRWTVINTKVSGTDYVTLLYFKQSGTNTNFYAKRGTIPSGTGTTISWNTEQLVFTNPNAAVCGSSTCAAVVAATDTSGNIFAAFRWYDTAYNAYLYSIYRSTDGGLTWPSSGIGRLLYTSGSPTRIEMFLTSLPSGRMLFGIARYATTDLLYHVFDGSTWSSPGYATGTGLSANTIKQVSSASNSQSAYVVFPLGGTSGNIGMAVWSSTGSYVNSISVTTGTFYSYTLPRAIINPLDNDVRVFSIISPSLSNSAIVEIRNANCAGCGTIYSTGDTGTSPYPNQLISAVKYPSFMFTQTSGTTTIKFNGHSYVSAPYSTGAGLPINSGGGGCILGASSCDFWDTTTGKMRNWDAPGAGQTLTSQEEFNTVSPPGNSPVFWRAATGDVSWGYNFNAIGQFSSSKPADTASARVGVTIWRCPAASAGSSCTAPYAVVTSVVSPQGGWTVTGTNLSVSELNRTFSQFVTQTGGYRYMGVGFAQASAHSDMCTPACGAAVVNFGNSASSANYMQVNYIFREMQ